MTISVLKSKIHRATVTDANLNYEGSLTVDIELMNKVGMYEYEKVHVVNINNGARFETYLIKGETGSGEICLNGAAARLGQVGDKVIIIAYAQIKEEDVKKHKPSILLVNDKNKPVTKS
ncbi:MAG: aspartate 1-decarboxylase [Spirochaetia bacterium]|nr:aspartate 1-decarboxylase [Spirochaetia bacterium]